MKTARLIYKTLCMHRTQSDLYCCNLFSLPSKPGENSVHVDPMDMGGL